MSAFRGTGDIMVGGAPKDKKDYEAAGRKIDAGGPTQWEVAPTPSNPGIKKRVDAFNDASQSSDEARERMRARGRASTMLTGGMGLMAAPTVARRTLLGA